MMRQTFTTAIQGITVEVDPPRAPDTGAHFAGLLEFLGGPDHVPGKVSRVHVMSAHAGGEIRSYELDGESQLRLAGPCHGGRWPEMDAEVARVLGASVYPYEIYWGSVR